MATSGFIFGQWNDPSRRKQQPEPKESSSATKFESPTVPECSHCHSQNLRPAGWFTSKRWEERHEDVQCRTCHRYSRLPVGVVLPRKAPRVIETESVLLATDPRPSCPRCYESRVQRRDKLPSGKRRYFCTKCEIRFIADDCAEFIDHRRVQHFHEITAQEEALFFYHYARRTGTVETLRRDIGYSESEKKCLEFLAANGMLADTNIAPMLKFRDEVLQKFNSLVDAELQVLAESHEKKEEQVTETDFPERTPLAAADSGMVERHGEISN